MKSLRSDESENDPVPSACSRWHRDWSHRRTDLLHRFVWVKLIVLWVHIGLGLGRPADRLDRQADCILSGCLVPFLLSPCRNLVVGTSCRDEWLYGRYRYYLTIEKESKRLVRDSSREMEWKFGTRET
jgi:hypothetical protein